MRERLLQQHRRVCSLAAHNHVQNPSPVLQPAWPHQDAKSHRPACSASCHDQRSLEHSTCLPISTETILAYSRDLSSAYNASSAALDVGRATIDGDDKEINGEGARDQTRPQTQQRLRAHRTQAFSARFRSPHRSNPTRHNQFCCPVRAQIPSSCARLAAPRSSTRFKRRPWSRASSCLWPPWPSHQEALSPSVPSSKGPTSLLQSPL